MRISLVLIGILIALFVIIWVGLSIKPSPYPSLSASKLPRDNIPIPDTLPPAVENFYAKIYGSDIPAIESAVISGRAKMQIMGITFPARFRFIHKAGKSYRHIIELTLFGLPVIKVNEYYFGGNAKLELPFGTVENEPNVDQGANLALWGEAIWFPSIYLTDPRPSWEPVDDDTAILKVPFGDKQQQIIVRFDPKSNMPQLLEAMRYKEADDEEKTLWIIETNNWKTVENKTICTTASITWFDEGDPWAVFNVEEVAYNLDVNIEEYVRSEKINL